MKKLPDLYALKAEYKRLAEEKERMYELYDESKKQMQEYGIIKQNVDGILRMTPGKDGRKSYELTENELPAISQGPEAAAGVLQLL